jgi:tetratricopeptide (TPR) repeat protein
MILTNCAACAAPLGLSLGKKCGRCSTRYCGPACQVQHWKEGGHDNLCKKIKKAGGAEQYNANQKYTEAVSVAVEKCAEDTKGQTCYICTEVVHRRTGEGLVRGCACHTTEGFVHVSCLAEQAKILWGEVEENNLDDISRWHRWHMCNLCEHKYHGVVRCALGWACWKMYLGRPEEDPSRLAALNQLGNGLYEAEHHADALSVQEAQLSLMRRLGESEDNILAVKGNISCTYQEMGRLEEALSLRRDVYSGRLTLQGEEHLQTFLAANNYTSSLVDLQRCEEAKSLLRKTIPVARRVLGESNDVTLKLRRNYAEALYRNDSATLDDLREAVTTLEETERTARRVLGGAHPDVVRIELALRESQAALDATRSS